MARSARHFEPAKSAANPRVSQKVKWISDRKRAPYSMYGKYKLPTATAASPVLRPKAAQPSRPMASGSRALTTI